MDKNVRFYICEKCKNQVGMIKDNGPKLMCCGNEMELMKINKEKNLPKFDIKDNKIIVNIQKEEYTKNNENDIMWVALVSKNQTIRKRVESNQNSKLIFDYIPNSDLYVYSEKYGLLKDKIKK
ncbi:MAG: hypothetical protein E7311_02850 [Clostridiales bacterium]|nr:hypothetical protein [Clostridiales bacterium]